MLLLYYCCLAGTIKTTHYVHPDIRVWFIPPKNKPIRITIFLIFYIYTFSE